MSKITKTTARFPISRIAMDAVLIALYFGLSLLSVQLGGIKITFASLPAMICAVLFGPVDAFLVGFLGAFLEQMLSFGFTATTLLWVLPPAIRGLFIGVFAKVLRNQLSPEQLVRNKRPYVYFLVCLASGIVVSLLNTAVYYVDAKMFHYYTYELIFGVLWLRLASGMVSSVLMAIVSLPVIAGVSHTALIPKKVKA